MRGQWGKGKLILGRFLSQCIPAGLWAGKEASELNSRIQGQVSIQSVSKAGILWTPKDKDKGRGILGAGWYLVWVHPKYEHPDEKGTGTV